MPWPNGGSTKGAAGNRGIPSGSTVLPRPCGTTRYTKWSFKLIATTTYTNYGTAPYKLTLNITQSAAVGSEFSGSVEFTVEAKSAILGGVSARAGVGVKETRSTNEAVGASAEFYVSPGRKGFLEAYWGGESANGTLFWDTYYGGTYQSTQSAPVGAFVHTSVFDVNFKGWEQ